MDPLYLSNEENGADDIVSRNTVTVLLTTEKGKNSGMDVWTDYSIDAPIKKD